MAGQGDSVWTTSVMGGPPHKLRDDAYAWGVSPEGAQIAFATNPGKYGDPELWLMDSDGERTHKLYDVDQKSGFTQVEWSPVGGRVAYTKKVETLDKVDIVLETRDLKGGIPIRVFSGVPLSRLWEFCWLPGGKMIYLLVEPDINLYSVP